MSAEDDVDQLIEQFQQALDEFLKGDPEPAKRFFSYREDVTLANPFGPPVRGWDEVAKVSDRAASQVRDGEMTGFETVAKYVTPELAYGVWIERPKASLEQERISPRSLCGLQ